MCRCDGRERRRYRVVTGLAASDAALKLGRWTGLRLLIEVGRHPYRDKRSPMSPEDLRALTHEPRAIGDVFDGRPVAGMVTPHVGDRHEGARCPSPILPSSDLNLGSFRTGSNSTAAVIRINEPSRSSKRAVQAVEEALEIRQPEVDQGAPHRRHIAVSGTRRELLEVRLRTVAVSRAAIGMAEDPDVVHRPAGQGDRVVELRECPLELSLVRARIAQRVVRKRKGRLQRQDPFELLDCAIDVVTEDSGRSRSASSPGGREGSVARPLPAR